MTEESDNKKEENDNKKEESDNKKEEIIREEVKEYIDEEGVKVIERRIYIKVEDNKWKGQKKYYDSNKDEIKKNIVEYNRNRYKTDEVYRDSVKAKRRESYLKKKELKEINK
jgi:hypothetical protein